MGNVNGSGNPSGSARGAVVEQEIVQQQQQQQQQQHGGTTTNTAAPPMGQSPPHSPTASLHSPLKFAPQPPVAPIDEDLHIPNPSWLDTSPPDDHDHDDINNYQQGGIPTMITWSHPANHVSVQGSWDNWNSRKPLQRCGKDFILMKVLPSGVYQYRFIVDGTPTYAPDLPSTLHDSGNYYNVLDLQDYVPEDTESISGFEPPQSPDGSYNNTELNQEDFAKEPPLVPPHLNMTLLNAPSLCSEVPTPSLARPQHVILNHLYMQKGKSGPSVVALGSTHRFKAKYVTVVLYKSL